MFCTADRGRTHDHLMSNKGTLNSITQMFYINIENRNYINTGLDHGLDMYYSYYLANIGPAPALMFFLDVFNFCSSHHIPPHQTKTDLFRDIEDMVNFSHIHVILGVWFFLQNNIPASAMTRRNTYVCTDRSNTDRHSLLQNGKENR